MTAPITLTLRGIDCQDKDDAPHGDADADGGVAPDRVGLLGRGRAARRMRQRPRITARIASDPMSPEELQAAERLVARLVARAFAADRPELFGPHLPQVLDRNGPGPPPTARAEVASPTTSGGGSGSQPEIGDDFATDSQTRQE